MADAQLHTDTTFVVTCEHAGKEVPARYRRLFHGAMTMVAGPDGHDPGALGVAMRMATRLHAPLHFSAVTRLLVDCDRSPDDPEVFSTFTRGLEDEHKRALIGEHYVPYRTSVRRTIDGLLDAGHAVVHVAVHAFDRDEMSAPADADIVLMYDERRAIEAEVFASWGETLGAQYGDFDIDVQTSGRSVERGLCGALRRKQGQRRYAGVHVDVDQDLVSKTRDRVAMGDALVATLRGAIAPAGPSAPPQR